MSLFFIALLFATIGLGAWAYQEHQKIKQQRQFIVIGGITLALIATILTIISAIISIAIGLHSLFDDHLWWWFH